MKRILLAVSVLFSCNSNDHVVITKKEYYKLTKQKQAYPKAFNFITESSVGSYNWEILKGEDSHEYLTNNGHNTLVVIHYPDCKKCNK